MTFTLRSMLQAIAVLACVLVAGRCWYIESQRPTSPKFAVGMPVECTLNPGKRMEIVYSMWFQNRPGVWHSREGWWYRCMVPAPIGKRDESTDEYVHESYLSLLPPRTIRQVETPTSNGNKSIRYFYEETGKQISSSDLTYNDVVVVVQSGQNGS